MTFELYDSGSATEIKNLFTRVFTDSEGKEEGELIGNLALELQQTTAAEDIYGFVVKDGAKIVGCIFFTRITFDTPVNAFILAPVAIATEYQKQGLGQRLIQFGMDYLKERQVELLLTYGDPNFYSKVGFKPVTEAVAKAPFTLSFPHGWLAQNLTGDSVEPMAGRASCVKALNNKRYW